MQDVRLFLSPQCSQVVQILETSLPNHSYPAKKTHCNNSYMSTAKRTCFEQLWGPVMGEVEDVEVVEVCKDVPLHRAQLVPRQPGMLRHNRGWFCHNHR